MPIDNEYNRMISNDIHMINLKYINSQDEGSMSASFTFGNAKKGGCNNCEGGTILGPPDGYEAESEYYTSEEEESYLTLAVQPASGIAVKAGKYTSVRDLGSMDEPVSALSEPVKSITIGGYELHADDDELEEGGIVVSDEGKTYKKSGGLFWFIAIAIAIAKAAAKKAAALAIKLAIKAAKAAVKKAVKKKIKGKVKQKIKQKIKDRIKEQVKKEVKKEVKGRVQQSAREKLENLKTGDPKVDNQGFERIIDRTMELNNMRADPDMDPQRIKDKEAAIRRAETIAHYKGYKDYLINNRVGKDSNFTQADVDELKRKIEEKVRKENEYTLKRAKENAEREKAKIRAAKQEAISAYEDAFHAKHDTKDAIAANDQAIIDLKKDFKQLLRDKKIARVHKEQLLQQQKAEYEAAQKEKDAQIRNYIRELGTPEERKQLEAKEKEEHRQYLQAKKDEEALKKEKERLEKEAKEEEKRQAKELSERLAKEEKERQERLEKEAYEKAKAIKKEQVAERVKHGNINDYSGKEPEREPVRVRNSFFSGGKRNKKKV